ncbi:MAG: helix-turn-helix domain-containing protein [Ramlibacter sp.]|nr:AraC family transcriptional regulator [Ramlibacter sp.]
MSTPFDLIFDNAVFSAQVVFVGTRCGGENLLRDYASGALHFVRAGRALVHLPGSAPVPVEEPSLVFFPRANRHGLGGVNGEGIELVCAIANFSETFQQTVAVSLPAMVVLPLRELAPVRHAVEAFFAEAASTGPGSRQLADQLCGIVLAYVVRHIALEQQQRQAGVLAAASDQRIAGAVRAIHASFHAGVDLATLAKVAGMSRSRFVEHFKRLVGTSPHNYLVSYRIGVAQQLLAKRLPVKTVAERVGYETTASFVRKFKEVVGVSPGAWAK